jgi:hypothetical protein
MKEGQIKYLGIAVGGFLLLCVCLGGIAILALTTRSDGRGQPPIFGADAVPPIVASSRDGEITPVPPVGSKDDGPPMWDEGFLLARYYEDSPQPGNPEHVVLFVLPGESPEDVPKERQKTLWEIEQICLARGILNAGETLLAEKNEAGYTVFHILDAKKQQTGESVWCNGLIKRARNVDGDTKEPGLGWARDFSWWWVGPTKTDYVKYPPPTPTVTPHP